MELTTPQAAAALGLSEQAVRDHVTAGRLVARRHGFRKTYKFREEDVREFATKYQYVIDEDAIPRPVRQN